MGICGIYIVSAKLLSHICEVRECLGRAVSVSFSYMCELIGFPCSSHGMCLFVVVVVLPFDIRGSLPLVSWWPYLNVFLSLALMPMTASTNKQYEAMTLWILWTFLWKTDFMIAAYTCGCFS